MLRLLDVVDQLRAAADRDRVASAMLDFLASIYTRSAFFVSRKGFITSFAARGALAPEALRALSIPVDAPSLLRDVVAECSPYRGLLPSGPLNALLANALGGWPAEIILAPVRIRERVVGVVYADGPKQSVPEGVLEKLAVEAGAAYERILLSAKPASARGA